MTALQIRLALSAVAGLALVALVVSWVARGAEIDRLETWSSTVIHATTEASVPPDKDGNRKLLKAEQVPAAIAALRSTVMNCEGTLAGITENAMRDKAVQAQLDKQLAAILAGQQKQGQAADAVLRDLAGRQGTGDRTKDCATMEADSNAAWDGWRH